MIAAKLSALLVAIAVYCGSCLGLDEGERATRPVPAAWGDPYWDELSARDDAHNAALDQRAVQRIEADTRDIYERYGIERPRDEHPEASRLGRERRARLHAIDEDKEAEEAARYGR